MWLYEPMEDERIQAPQGSLMRRINTTDEMTRAVMFLASDDATSMTGMDLDVTGAFLAK